tara:strand:- start:199 stop:990 length:792 start_codon:yes stop_codon:yes gene_type:complete
MNIDIKIAHLINPFNCKKNNPSYLYYAQPITFKSMHEAQLEGHKYNIDVKLYSVNFPEDDAIIPSYFIKLPYLKKSTLTEFPEISSKRKLPIIQEMFNSILKNSDADFLIFSNSDIGLQKEFYREIYDLIIKDNLKSFIINRRDGLPKFKNGFRLNENNLFEIYKEKGFKHPGKDCFIVSRKILQDINMNKMFTGYPPWGNTFYYCLKKKNKECKLYRNKYLTFHIGRDKPWKKNPLWFFGKKKKDPLWLKNEELSEIVKNFS